MYVLREQHDISIGSVDRWYIVHRMVEITVSGVLLVCISPVIVFAALAITFSTRGSAVLVQERVGRFGIPFRCYKLRTMYCNAPLGPSHVVGQTHYTVVGRVLRKTGIDELPQLWNVLNGTMRLVGPRPCLPLQHEIVAQRQRSDIFSVHPGITGWAQSRNIDMSDPDALIAADRSYVENRSTWLDLQIMFRTAVMMIGKVMGR